MSELGSQLKKGFADQASNDKFLALLNNSHRIQSLKDKEIIPSIPLSSFNPTELPSIHKQKIKLKSRSYSETKLKPIKEIKKESLKNIPSLSELEGLQGKNMSNMKQQRNHSSESLRNKNIIQKSYSRKNISFTPNDKQKKLVIDTTTKTKTNLSKISNLLALEEIKGEKTVLLLNLKFGKIQQNLSYRAFLQKQTDPSPQEIIADLNYWAAKYRIKSGLIQTENLQSIFRRKQIPNALILAQFSNHLQLRSEYMKIIPGLQFYDPKNPSKGRNLAAFKIQSLFKMNFDRKYARKLNSLMNKVKIIQKHWKISLMYRKTKQIMLQNINTKIEKVQSMNKQLMKNWQFIRNSPRFQIHICSFSLEQFKRLSIQKIREKQNAQITRIFRAVSPDVRIIYVTPYQLSSQVLRYYERIFKVNSPLDDIRNRIFFIDLEEYANFQMFQYLTTTSLLLYSAKAIKKIQNIIATNQQNILNCQSSYIVPSYPSNQYINLSAQLGIPLFSMPQSLAKLYSTKSGYHQLFRNISQKSPFKLLKTVENLYSQVEVINSLAVLIFKYREVQKWYLKIDDEIQSRGLAVLHINSLSFLRQLKKSEDQDLQQKSIIKLIASQLTVKLKHRLKILHKDVYHDYHQFMSHFTTRGGIIEAAPVNKCQQHSISLLIQPNGDFSLLFTYSRLQLGGKTINSSLKSPSDLSVQEINNQKIIMNLYRHLWGKHKFFGYFTVDFLYDSNQCELYLIGIDCFLNSKTCSLFIPIVVSRGFYDKQINAISVKSVQTQQKISQSNKELHYIYYPLINLHNLPQIPKFFKNCKFNNISFDLENKVGTIFLLVGEIQNGCLGFMTISNSLAMLLEDVKKLVDFLARQYRQIKKGNDQLGKLRGVLVNWLRKIKKNTVYKQDLNLSMIF